MAEIETLPFDQTAVNRINDWVDKKTNSKIKKIVYQLNRDDIMVLLNAIYFKGNWKKQFEKRLTTIQDFRLLNNDEVPTPMMKQDGEYQYVETGNIQMVRLPYEDDNLGMYIILPDRETDFIQFLNSIDSDKFLDLQKQMSRREGTLVIPKLKLDYEIMLNDVLKAMGMQIAFGAKADFGKMTESEDEPEDERLYISRVRHKAFVEINEEGTEAAAATAVIMAKCESIAPTTERFTFVADHPYLFLIQDKNTDAILFMGSITNPQ
jgi:serpin B